MPGAIESNHKANKQLCLALKALVRLADGNERPHRHGEILVDGKFGNGRFCSAHWLDILLIRGDTPSSTSRSPRVCHRDQKQIGQCSKESEGVVEGKRREVRSRDGDGESPWKCPLGFRGVAGFRPEIAQRFPGRSVSIPSRWPAWRTLDARDSQFDAGLHATKEKGASSGPFADPAGNAGQTSPSPCPC